MGEITRHGRQLAKYVADLMVTKPEVRRSEWHGHIVDVLVGPNFPQDGTTTLYTVSLSSRNVIIDGVEQDFGIELATCHSNSMDGCIDVIFDAAFLYVEHGEEFYPGAVLPDLIGRRGLSETMKHFFLITPFLWDGKLKSIKGIGDRETRYLLAVPISDAEMALAGTEGSEALDDLFEQEQIDIFDWNRPSITQI
ncbi:MAG: suppressor of fused domain protein [Pseudonocardiaceae bacterium]